MIRYIGSIVSGLLASLAIFWLAAFLVREPAGYTPQKPRTIKMPRVIAEKDLRLKSAPSLVNLWDISRTRCCCYPPHGGIHIAEGQFVWPQTDAQVSPMPHRPHPSAPMMATLASLLAEHTQPTVINAPYPRTAQARGLEGDVLVEAILAADGSVASATVVGAAPIGLFDKVALEAVMETRFDAPIRDGQQVRPMTRRFLIKFRLPAAA